MLLSKVKLISFFLSRTKPSIVSNVLDPLAHTIPAAFYRNLHNDLVIEYIPTRTDFHEIFIRTQNNLLDICPIRVMAFECKQEFECVLRVQVKEILEHTFSNVIDTENKLEIQVTGKRQNKTYQTKRIVQFQIHSNELFNFNVRKIPKVN